MMALLPSSTLKCPPWENSFIGEDVKGRLASSQVQEEREGGKICKGHTKCSTCCPLRGSGIVISDM